MKQILLGIGIIGLSACSQPADNESNSHLENSSIESTQQQKEVISKVITGDEFKQKMTDEGVQLVDVRTAEEYASGHIGDALNYDFFGSDFQSQIASLDKERPVLVYCKSGGRSGKTAKMLEELGFTEIYDLAGGYSSWSE